VHPLLFFFRRLIAHTIRKWKRRAKKHFNKTEDNIIDLSLVRGHRDSGRIERETSQRSSALTCPQLLALSGALGALPQVALGGGPVTGLPDWSELSHSLRKLQPISFSAPVLTLTSPVESPPQNTKNNRDYPQQHRDHQSNEHHSRDKNNGGSCSTSDIFSISHRHTEELGPCRSRVRQLVESKLFQQGILGAILINTLSMGVEFHDQVSKVTSGAT